MLDEIKDIFGNPTSMLLVFFVLFLCADVYLMILNVVYGLAAAAGVLYLLYRILKGREDRKTALDMDYKTFPTPEEQQALIRDLYGNNDKKP
jgi:hypothetical protein